LIIQPASQSNKCFIELDCRLFLKHSTYCEQ